MRPRKPLWTKGLFLTQHHLQAQDRYHERLVHMRMEALAPYGWGVVTLEIDAAALRAGQLRVARLEAILPDGVPLSIGDEVDDLLPARAVDGFTGRALAVQVALPREGVEGVGASIAEASGSSEAARYLVTQGTATDLATGEDERSLPWLRHNARIVFGDQPDETVELLPIAELVRASSGAVVLRDTFVPPSVRIGASRFLVEGFNRVLTAMSAKQQSLAMSRRMRTASVVEFQAADAAKFWLLHTLNQALPAIAEIAEKPSTHPQTAHAALAQLIGMLSTFDPDSDPAKIPRYDHLAIGDVFEPMFARALALLDSVIAERHVTIPLTVHEHGLYTGEIRDAAILAFDFFLAVSGKLPEAQIRDHVPRLAKISARSRIESLMHSAVPGARLAPEYRVPAALPVRPGVLFFRIEKASEYWREVLTSGTFALYLPVEPATLQVQLYASDPATLQ